jgi:hypothetical protein
MNGKEDIVAYEAIGGWPVFKMNVREILEGLGGKVEDGKVIFDLSNPIMELYPVCVRDDGMRYGVDETFITEVSCGEDFVTIFREKEDKEKEKHLKEWFNDED